MGASAQETTELELQAALDDTRVAGLSVVQGLTQLAMQVRVRVSPNPNLNPNPNSDPDPNPNPNQDPALASVIERKMVEAGIQPPGTDDAIDEMDDVDLSQYE